MDMSVYELLTSLGFNTCICLLLLSLYSVLRKQPSFVNVYFGQKLSQVNSQGHDNFCFDRLFPSPSWIMKAWDANEDELFRVGGVDAVVFLRAVVLSVRVLTVSCIICLFLILPLNYCGNDMEHKEILHDLITVFTIGNVKEGSKWLWVHCVALYIITLFACVLLYFEYKGITKMRMAHISTSFSYPSHFTVVVRAIPWADGESYSEMVKNFFTDFYASSYLSHQMVYHSGAVQKLMTDAEQVYQILKSARIDQQSGAKLLRCGICGGTSTSFKMMAKELDEIPEGRSCFDGSDLRKKESGAALVFFRTRYAALVAAEALQSPNPMLWVTDAAPEPNDIFWPNLSVPYRLLWIRRISVVVASVAFVIFFLVPVVFTQSLVNLDKMEKVFPFLKRVMEKRAFLKQVTTGYLPSVIFMFFLYLVPPTMMVFSTLEGAISRSGRKRSTCIKVVYFFIWNLFFANILTEAAIDHYQVSITNLGDPKNIPNLLAKAVPATATFFMTYVLTSGWASLSLELIQPFSLLCNLFYRYVLKNKDISTYGAYTFPYHTEVPRVLLFGLLGFTCSILTPLILPFLLVYFALAFLVYRNQLLNVYITEYDSGGLYWPVVHNTTIFSLVLTQIIGLGVFGIKKSPTASGFTIPLIILTLLFNEYCRQRFLPVFNKIPARTLIEMDRMDEHSGKMMEIHHNLETAYFQFRRNLHKSQQNSIKREDSGIELDSHSGPVNPILRSGADVEAAVDVLAISPGNRSIQLPESWPGRTNLEIKESRLID